MMGHKNTLIFSLSVFAVLLFLEMPRSWLFDPDEARYAEIPQSMIASGDYLTPRLNGSNYFEKPPLLYWLNALSLQALGDTPFAARLPVRLATLATALLIFLSLKSKTSLAHLWGALIFLSAILPFSIGRINLTDGIVSFGITLTLLSARAFISARNQNREETWLLTAIGLGTTVSVLSKGFIGILLPGLILTIWSAFTGQWSKLKEIVLSRASIIILLLAGPWFVLMELRHPGFWNIFFIREHLFRYFTDGANRPGSVLYFFPVLLLGMLPWTLFLLAALRSFFLVRPHFWRHHSDKLFFTTWLITIFVFFSFSHSKLIPYLLPAFPAAAILTGTFIEENLNKLKRPLFWTAVFWPVLALSGIFVGSNSDFFNRYELFQEVGLIATLTITAAWFAVAINRRSAAASLISLSLGWAAMYAVLITTVPKLATGYSLHDMAVKARETNADHVVSFGTFPHSFPLVLKKAMPVVNCRGELSSDGVMSPELFLTEQMFSSIWNSTQSVIAVYRKDQHDYFMRQTKKPMVIYENRKHILSKNQESKNGTTTENPGKS